MTTEEKLERFRKFLTTGWRCANDGVLEEVLDKFFELFPPPRKAGAWCFWMDRYAGSGPNRRGTLSYETEREATEARDRFSHLNPGPVFFLAEEGK